MNLRYTAEREPIELLLGMAGAVQYLEHAPKDERTYAVWVKTKTGNKQILIPIEAVRLIQSQKPNDAVIDSIRGQLATEASVQDIPILTQTQQPASSIGGWFRNLLGIRK